MFTSLFGDSPQARLLGFLVDHHEFDYTIMELSRHAGVSRPATYKVVEALTDKEVLVLTRTVGASRFYRLNVDHRDVRRLIGVQAEGPLAAPRPGRRPARGAATARREARR